MSVHTAADNGRHCLRFLLTTLLFSGIVKFTFGAVSERFKEAVLKTVVPEGTGGSNPPCSGTDTV